MAYFPTTDTGVSTNIKTVTESYGMLPTDATVISDSVGNSIFLPDPAAAPVGATYRVANSPNGSVTTIGVNASGTLIGALQTLFLPAPGCAATLQSDGANYAIVGLNILTIDPGGDAAYFSQGIFVDPNVVFAFGPDGTVIVQQIYVRADSSGTPTDFHITPTSAVLPPLVVEGSMEATGGVSAFSNAPPSVPGPVTGQVTGGTLAQLQTSYAALLQQLHFLGFIDNQTT